MAGKDVYIQGNEHQQIALETWFLASMQVFPVEQLKQYVPEAKEARVWGDKVIVLLFGGGYIQLSPKDNIEADPTIIDQRLQEIQRK